jgi:hypothetical protein
MSATRDLPRFFQKTSGNTRKRVAFNRKLSHAGPQLVDIARANVPAAKAAHPNPDDLAAQTQLRGSLPRAQAMLDYQPDSLILQLVRIELHAHPSISIAA